MKVEHAPGEEMQVLVYNKCANEYKNESMWAAFIDIDEFIFLRKHDDIKHLLSDLVPNGGALSLNWILYGSGGHTKYSSEPVLKRFVLRASAPNAHVKSISYLPHVTNMDVHHPELKNGTAQVDCHGHEFKGPFNLPGSEDIASIHHYITKSFEEYSRKRLRGRADSRGAADHYKNKTHGFQRLRDSFQWFDAADIQDSSAWDYYRSKQMKASKQN